MIVEFNSNTWSDPWFSELPRHSQLLFIYLWTNDHKNISGLYVITPKTIKGETNLSEQEIWQGLKDLTAETLVPKVKYDARTNLVWIVNHVKHQFQRTENVSGSIVIGINKSLRPLPIGHPFIFEFLERYPLTGVYKGKDVYISYPFPLNTSFAVGLPPLPDTANDAPAGVEPPPPTAPPVGVSPKKPKKATQVNPDGFIPSADDIAYGKTNGLDSLEIEYQLERFKAYATKRAAKKPNDAYKDLSRAFREWLTSQYFKPMPQHVRAARLKELQKKQDEIKYDIKPVEEVGPEMQIPKLPWEER